MIKVVFHAPRHLHCLVYYVSPSRAVVKICKDTLCKLRFSFHYCRSGHQTYWLTTFTPVYHRISDLLTNRIQMVRLGPCFSFTVTLNTSIIKLCVEPPFTSSLPSASQSIFHTPQLSLMMRRLWLAHLRRRCDSLCR